MDGNGIKKLEIRNVKRLKAVTIVPSGSMIVIAGPNGAGKSSVIDAIWFALGGTRVHDPMPIREGSRSAEVSLVFNEWTVKRVWNANGTHLEVRSPDHLVPKPQTFLDEMIGTHALDPMKFLQLSAREAVGALLERFPVEILGLSLDETNGKIAALKTDRRETKSHRDAMANAAESMRVDDGPGPRKELDELDAESLRIKSARANLVALSADLGRIDSVKLSLETRIEECRATHQRLIEEHGSALREFDETRTRISELGVVTADQVDGAEIAVRRAIEHNANVDAHERSIAERHELRQKAAHYEIGVQNFNREINALEFAKVEALASVEFPISGLAFNEERVLYNHIPLEQCAMSERIRVACAIAMHGDPPLKVIRISDASVLDDESMAELETIVNASGFQAWVERIEPGGSHCVEIRDGEIAEETRGEAVVETAESEAEVHA